MSWRRWSVGNPPEIGVSAAKRALRLATTDRSPRLVRRTTTARRVTSIRRPAHRRWPPPLRPQAGIDPPHDPRAGRRTPCSCSVRSARARRCGHCSASRRRARVLTDSARRPIPLVFVDTNVLYPVRLADLVLSCAVETVATVRVDRDHYGGSENSLPDPTRTISGTSPLRYRPTPT
jgi:hypothetical protein